ncbi:MAG TPA: peptidoglycan-binding protein [Gemmatimonadales bacterium]|nr:peptidoglycan-binding protein [Gemmatimonadales bacterium]
MVARREAPSGGQVIRAGTPVALAVASALALALGACEPGGDVGGRPGGEGRHAAARPAAESVTSAGATAQPVTSDSTARATSAVLEQLLFSQAAPPELPQSHWNLIRRLYDARRYAPLWAGPTVATDTGRARQALLCRAAREGVAVPPEAPESLAQRDLRLTTALLRYLETLAHGERAPATVGAAWRVPAPAAPDDSTLAAAVRMPDAAALARLEPAGAQPRRLGDALARLLAVEAAGGWPRLPDSARLRPGARDSAVPVLRRRLVLSGDLPAADSAGGLYDATVRAAVRRFQIRLGLAPDGRIGAETRHALAVPAAERARTVAANLERYRWLPRAPQQPTLLFDLGEGAAQLWRGGAPVLSLPVRATPACRALPPVLADTLAGARGDSATLTLALRGGATLTLRAGHPAARPRATPARADGACLVTDDLAGLRAALGGGADAAGVPPSPLLVYYIFPTVLVRDDTGLVFRRDTTGADAGLTQALPAPRPAPAACAAGTSPPASGTF